MTTGGAAAPPGRRWDTKLDPFLRRAALGVTRHQGLFADHIPARSREAVRTLPAFVRARRDAADPVLYVKGRVDEDALAAGPDRRVQARALAGRLAALGVELRGRAGDIMSLAVPASALEALASLPEVRWLKASRSYQLMNDVSTTTAFVGSRAENASFGNSGQGVIVAVVDTGIEWHDDDFRNLDGTTRILGIWDQTLTDPAHPPPAGFTFGAFYSKADIDAALANSTALLTGDEHGHGTHVAGTAAGNGRHTGNGIPAGTYAGVAPAADILVVRVFDGVGNFCNDCDLVSGTQFIDQFATAAGKPWVGNMSLGDDTGGAHDGTSPDELAIDAVVGAGRPGAQMAIAAGNSGSVNRHFHWDGNLAGTGATLTNTFTLPSYTPAAGSDTDIVILDLWYEGVDNATVQVQTPGAQMITAARGADSGIVCTTSGAVQVDATNAADPANGDNQVIIIITDSATCAPVVAPATGSWTVRVTTNSLGGPTGGPFDLWDQACLGSGCGFGFVNLTTFNLAKSVSVPGTARNALTAGAIVSKVSWINSVGSPFTASTATVGSLASFSGIGPTRDGRIKPDVAAPGMYISSTLAGLIKTGRGVNFTERDGVHGNISGTSMATPHLAGTAALLFGINPALDGAQVRTALQRSARVDLQTGAVPNNRFGWGKLRAFDGAYDAAAIVTGLGATSAAGAFAWAPVATVDSWNVYRGTIPGISATNYGSCFRSGLASPDFSDTAVPAPGEGFFYLVTGVYTSPSSGLPVEGSLGTNSAGSTRPNNAPCP